MPRVTIPGVGDVMMPDSMPKDEIMARATAMQQAALTKQKEADWQPDPRELGIGQLLIGGAERGLEGTKGTFSELLPALGASVLGKDEYAKQKLGEYQQRMQGAEEENPSAYSSYKQVRGIGDIIPAAAETLGELAPDIAGFIGGAGIGELGGKYLAKKAATKSLESALPEYIAKRGLSEEAAASLQERVLKQAAAKGADIGSKAGLWGTSLATNVPDVFNSIYQDTGELHPGIALTIGPIVAALDTYLPEKMLHQLGSAGKKTAAAQLLEKSTIVPPTWKKAFIGETLKTIGGESFTEGGQQALQILASQIAGDKQDFFSSKNVDDIVNSALKGAVGGGVFGAPGAAVQASRNVADIKQKIEDRNQANALAAQQQQTPLSTLDQIKQQIAANKFKQAPVGTQGELFPELKTQQPPALNMPQAEETHPEPNPAQQELDLQGGYHFPSDEELDTAKQKAEEDRVLNNQIYQEQLQKAIAETDAQIAKGGIDRRQAARLDLLHPLLENVNITNTAELFQQKLRDAGYANVELTDTEKRLIGHADNFKTAIATAPWEEEASPETVRTPENELTPEITGIKEKGEKGPAGEPKQKEPKQLLIPGLPFPTKQERRAAQVEPEAEPEPQAESTVLDADTLASTGLTKQSGFYKQLLNKDLANPEHLQTVNNVLTQVRVNPNLSASTKQAIEGVATKAFRNLATQQPLFGPRGGIAKGAERGELKNTRPVSGNVSEPNGGSVSVSSKSQTKPAGGTEKSEPSTVVSTTKPADKSGERKRNEPSTLKKKEVKAETPAEIEEPEIPEHAYVEEETKGETKPKPAKKASKPTATTTPTTKTEKPPASGAIKDIKSSAFDEIEKAIEEKENVNPNAKPPKGLVETIKRGYTNFFRNDIKNDDDHIAVAGVILNTKEQSPAERAAKTYFKKMPRIIDGLFNISFDLINDTPQFRSTGESLVEAEFFKGMNGANAKLASDWVRSSLSEDSVKEFDHMLKYFEKVNKNSQNILDTLGRVYFDMGADETVDDYIETKKEDERGGFNLKQDAISRLSNMLHPVIISALEHGDLTTALNLLASQSDGFTSKLATQLAQVNADTKVEVVDNLKDEAGKPVAGLFDPKTNTIKLDSVTGLNSHVLLHEPVHAATSHVLDDPNHPVTRQLQQLFDKVKNSIPTAYGSTNLQEFVAEAKSNPEFQGLLKSINPDGQTHSAWDRFVRIIANFLRRMVGVEPKKLESAFDQADSLIDTILSPAPGYRDAGSLYAIKTPEQTKQFISRIDKVITSVPNLDIKQKAALSQLIKDGSSTVRSNTFAFLPMHAMGEIADPLLNGLGTKLNTTIDKKDGYKKKLNNEADAVVAEAKKAIKARPEQRDSFNTVVNESTIAGVDPTKPRSEYKDKLDDSGNRLEEDWVKLNAEYKKLDPVWQNLYKTMRDAYKGMYEEVGDVIQERIDSMNISKESKISFKTEIMDKLRKQGTIDPYFALGREGDYWLAYKYKDKYDRTEPGYAAFKTELERTARMEELKKLGATDIRPYSNLSEVDYRRAPSGSFVHSVLQSLEINKPKNLSAEDRALYDKNTDEIMRLFISTLPETSFAKSYQRRNNRAGYMDDSIGVFEKKIRSTIHQVASMKYNPQISGVVDNMRKFVDNVGKGEVEGRSTDNQLEKAYYEEFNKRLDYILNPKKSAVGSILSSAVYNYTLGFNVSSALVNLAQVPMVVAPYLKAHYTNANVAAAIGEASKLFMGSGTEATTKLLGGEGKTTKLDVQRSIANYAPDSKIGKKYATFIRVLSERGQIGRSQLHEMLTGDTRTGFLAKLNAASGWMFAQTERMNREVTMLAAYNLELAKLNKQGITGEAAEEQAANHAVYTAQLLNGSTSASAAPRIAQSGIGKLMFMYKTYGVTQYYMLMKAFREATHGETPEMKKAAWRQLGGIIGMTALMAGAQGLPMFGAAAIVYSLFCDDDDDDLDTVTRKHLGEFLYKGPLEYFTNLSIAGRIGLSDLIVRDSKAGGSNTTFKDQILEAVGGPVLSIGERLGRGMSKISEGNVERGLEDLLPSLPSNILKSGRYFYEGANTLRGDPITGEINAWNALAQSFGFAPADYTKQLEINAKEKGIDKAIVTKASKLKSRYYLAMRKGDIDGANKDREALLELGAKHSGLGINGGSIAHILATSKKAQDRATKEMVHGVRFSPRMRQEILESEREMDGE